MEWPVKIPYFASDLPVPLPSNSEIEEAAVFVDHNGYKVARVGNYVVKFGDSLQLDLVEGENMVYLRFATKTKIPKIYALYNVPEASMNYIVMEYIEGDTLDTQWKSLSNREKEDIALTLKQYFVELRNLPSPGYFGSLGRRRMPGGMFWTPEPNPAINGPFENEADLNEALALKYIAESEYRSAYRADFYRRSLSSVFRGHESKFTHGDFQRKNVIIRPYNSSNDGTSSRDEKKYEVTLIDWETSGWYPSYWEYSMAALSTRWDDDWGGWLGQFDMALEYKWVRKPMNITCFRVYWPERESLLLCQRVMVTILSDSDEPTRPNPDSSAFSESPRPAKRRRLYKPPPSSRTDIESDSQAEEGEEEEPGEDSVDDDDGIDIGPEGESEEDSEEESEAESEDGLPLRKARPNIGKRESTKQSANALIYQPKYYTNQEPVFVTQLTQPSSSPSRIRGPRWKKPAPQLFQPEPPDPDPTPSPAISFSPVSPPQAVPAENANDQQETEGSDEDFKAAIRASLKSLREETSVQKTKVTNRIIDNPRPKQDLALSPPPAINGNPDLRVLGLDFDPDDIPDVFDSSPLSSPRQAPRNGTILITSQLAPQTSQWRQSSSQQQSFRQTTLFGGIASNQSQSQLASRAWPLASQNEPPTHHSLNSEALKTWTFPMNLGTKRDYQYNISQRGLFHNLLVALPTGLGKTFIAATVMLNWFRWTKDAQIVFVAPTRPLVSQQVDACFNIVGIPRSQTTMLTGNVAPGLRAVEWQTKRVFFMTPQTLINDLKSGIADPKRIVLLVVDEAHRATGAYVYVEVVKFIQRFNTSFRVLALTATPGSTVETVQEVIDGLNISRVEIRTEESLDIRGYVHAKNVETITFSNSEDMRVCMEQFSKALKPVVEKLRNLNAYWGDDPMSLTPFGLTEARKKWMMSPAGRNANWGLKGMVNSIFTVLASLAHATELLKYHGLGPFYRNLVSFRDGSADGGQGKGGKYGRQILDDGSFKSMMTTLRAKMTDEDFIGHPKLEYLKQVILNHFLDADANNEGGSPSKTRVMVFSHFRDSAEEIVRVLKKHAPIVLPHVFVGQASAKGSDGMDQKKQLEVIKSFKEGTYNTIVATSIGEEGLDIGEVDLIICYDSSASPIRMLQRMGRTGRKRTGKVVLLLMEGKEEDKYIRAKDNYEKMQQIIASGTRFTFHEDKSPRIIPREIQPCVDERRIEIPIENTQAELPVPTKRGRAPKRPPKKFHMPDGVETGFTNALTMTGASKKRPKPRDSPEYREPSPELAELPPLSEVTLTPSQTLELRRNFQTVAGTSPQIMRYPRLDVYPVLQRFCRPTVNVPHTTLTRRLAKAVREMSEYGPDCDEKYEPYLPLDVEEWEPDEEVPSPISEVDEHDPFSDAFGTGPAANSLNQRQNERQDTLPQPGFSSLMCTQPSGSFGLNNDNVFPSQGNLDDDFPDIDQLFAESFAGNDPLARKNAAETEKDARDGIGDANDDDLAHMLGDDSDFSNPLVFLVAVIKYGSRVVVDRYIADTQTKSSYHAPHSASYFSFYNEAMADTQFDSALDLLRRLSPRNTKENLQNITTLVPELTEDLLASVDQPLEVRRCPRSKRDYLLCDYNRDGDSYRSPWSNEFDPPIEDGTVPSERVRKLEVEANRAFDTYRDLYYDGGVGSVYFWDLEDGFAGVVLLKKGITPGSKNSGAWDSIHVFEATDRGRTCHYRLTSTVILHLSTSSDSLGEMDLSGNMTRQIESDMAVNGDVSHVWNVGRLVEDMEFKMRNLLQEVYFGKAKDVVSELRSLQPLSETNEEKSAHRNVINAMMK
ncbi:ATP-dependent DNA helicase [Arthroderma uncinatum]|uniref:ATP-dependent DNA helicase n=1 Tax=Arthroderma uncinatum TaxID=74035 RepID=UPI00144AE31D|nr:ATP-dependent DNA helicase [Arthroderma uncinatum]KAF3484111.1 ATP-dependent DNA helicase [Arthroderma uncinatum]